MAASVSSVTFVPASEKGALDGFASRCECCGLVMKSSLETLLQQDIAAHVAWHGRKASK